MDERHESGTGPSTGSPRFSKPLLLAGAAIAALVAIALIVAVALPREPTAYPAGTPEAAFQDFYRAWEAGNIGAAYGYLSPEVTKELSLTEYLRMDTDRSWQRDQDRRLVLLAVDVTGDRAVLHIRVDQFSGGGLGGGRSSFERSVKLTRASGAWLIDEPLLGIASVGYGY